MDALAELLERVRQSDRRALARLLSLAERDPLIIPALDEMLPPDPGDTLVIGVTGPPGAGKSTLVNALITPVLASHGRVAVLAVDPSSPFSGGAILGDRVRMSENTRDANVFIRSFASRGEQGGLAAPTALATRILAAAHWPVVLVETLGIGQVELAILDQADCVTVVLPPGWGDSIQANKAGLTESGDVFVINKSDRDGADQSYRDLIDSLSLLQRAPPPQVFKTAALNNIGIDVLWSHLVRWNTAARDSGARQQRRQRQRRSFLKQALYAHVRARMDHYVDRNDLSAGTTLNELLDRSLSGLTNDPD